MKTWPVWRVSILAIAFAAFPAANGAGPSGFKGQVVVERLAQGFAPTVRANEGFGYRQAKGKFWEVTRGQVFNGDGMPPLLYDLAGSPYESNFPLSAMVYESATQKKTEQWSEAQRMFFEAAVTEGVSPRDAKVMYLLLVIQGSRWEVPGSRCFGSCHGLATPLEWRPVINDARTAQLATWVHTADPELDEIDRQAQSAIRANGPHIFPQPACDMFSGSTQVRKRCD